MAQIANTVLPWFAAMIATSTATPRGIHGVIPGVTVVTVVAACHRRIRLAIRHPVHRRISACEYPADIRQL
jgi:hypothetical protein